MCIESVLLLRMTSQSLPDRGNVLSQKFFASYSEFSYDDSSIPTISAKKSLGRRTNLSDPEDLVVKCNRELVGFTTPCAMSWAWDEINTKNNAVFVFIQANVANYFSDMEVTYQDITLATIDEAISGPRFVSEVGATRRRMNIISDISRPRTQRKSSTRRKYNERVG